eukprot:1161551-Pelagomonas_calceolata.AAC.4
MDTVVHKTARHENYCARFLWRQKVSQNVHADRWVNGSWTFLVADQMARAWLHARTYTHARRQQCEDDEPKHYSGRRAVRTGDALKLVPFIVGSS